MEANGPLTGIRNKAYDPCGSLETWPVPFISVLSSLFLFFFPPLITLLFLSALTAWMIMKQKRREIFKRGTCKGRRKFVIREILAHEHVKQIYSEPEDQGYK